MKRLHTPWVLLAVMGVICLNMVGCAQPEEAASASGNTPNVAVSAPVPEGMQNQGVSAKVPTFQRNTNPPPPK